MPKLEYVLTAVLVVFVSLYMKAMSRTGAFEFKYVDLNIGGTMALTSILLWSKFVVDNIGNEFLKHVSWVFSTATAVLVATLIISMGLARKMDEYEVELKPLRLVEEKERTDEQKNKITDLSRKQLWTGLASAGLGMVCIAFNMMLY